MFEDLKREHAAGLGSKERARLTMFVAGCLILGVTLVGLQSCPDLGEGDSVADQENGVTTPGTEAPEPVKLDPAELAKRGGKDVGGQRVEILEAYAPDLVTYMLTTLEGEPGPGARMRPSALQALPVDEVRGQVFDVEGVVVARAEEVFEKETQRLWSLVVQDEDGGQVVVVKHGFRADPGSGRPLDDYRGMGAREPIRVGQYVLARGYYIQRRTGTIGGSTLPEATPVLWGTNFRQQLEPADRAKPVASLEDIRWDLLRDRYFAETQRWDEPQLYEALQWARAQGVERIREMIQKGELDITEWDQELFSKWQPEVDVRDDAERPFTDGARGQWFKTSGLIASHAYEGWNTVPANKWAVDAFTVLDINTDHYAHTNIRNVSAFPLDRYTDIEGVYKEHVWIYGVFYKNHTFVTRRGREGMKGASPLTMPMFIVMHVEPRVYNLDESKYLGFMWIVAGSIVLLGLIFWIVFVRGESKEAARLEQYRIKLRQRMRAKGQGAKLPERPLGDAPPGDGPPDA
ncbi:MAG: hypothetical protein QNJ98_17520 [Planctomycetota bacterium]|nr:hypothetical protein [Planctomycetota bacterium]